MLSPGLGHKPTAGGISCTNSSASLLSAPLATRPFETFSLEDVALYLTLDHRIQRTWMQMNKNRQKFDNLEKLGQTAEPAFAETDICESIAKSKVENAHPSKIIPD
jgi:hypothetical protein